MPEHTSYNAKLIKATPDVIYRAFCHPQAIETWLAPDNMTGKIHSFNWQEGGGYEMSLYYNSGHTAAKGKTSGAEDRFTTQLIRLKPASEIIMSTRFHTQDERFEGEMIVEIRFESQSGGTEVSFTFKNIPEGIRPGDNEKGTAQSLEKLARYVERGTVGKVGDIGEIDEQDSDGSANAFQWK